MTDTKKHTVLESVALTSVQLFNIPKIKLHIPTPRPLPAMFVFSLVYASYFIICSGIMYDIVNEVPALGMKMDEYTGVQKPVAIMEGRLNGQYIIEGLSAGAMFAAGGAGYILLDHAVQADVT